MSSITVRNLDPTLKERLRLRAAGHGHSIEAEVRPTLHTVLQGSPPPHSRNLYDWIQARFAPLGGVDLTLPTREPDREPPRFDRCSSSTPTSCPPS
jgi:plasmid stability protein